MSKKKTTTPASSSTSPASAGPAENETEGKAAALSPGQIKDKADQTRKATLLQAGRLLEARFDAAYEMFQACYLDHVENNPNSPGKQFKFAVTLQVTLQPLAGDVAVQTKLSFGRRRSFTTDQQSVESEQLELPQSSGRDS